MPRRLVPLALISIVIASGIAAAQEPASEKLAIGSVDFGGRLFSVSDDPARDQRYRDLRSGPVVDRFRYTNDQKLWVFAAGADHVGYRDQRYFASYNKAGAIKASFEWNEIPLFNSTITRTPYIQISPGVFRLDDSLQLAIQTGTSGFSSLAPLARQFDLRSRRDIGAFHLTVTPARDLDIKLNVATT